MRLKKLYDNGGNIKKPGDFAGLGDVTGAAAALGTGFIDAIAPPNAYGRQPGAATAAKSTLSGAAAGSAFGPIGAGVGAVIGLGTGLIAAKRQKDEEQHQKATDASLARQYQLDQYSARAAQDPFLTSGRPKEEYFGSGGSLNSSFIQFKAKGGTLQQLSSDTVEVKGPSHAQGGVQLGGGNEVEGNETIKGDYVLSSRLGFAQLHKPIAKAIGILEQKPFSTVTMKSMDRLRKQEQALMVLQEHVRQQNNLD